jgi:hypothetical protein
MTRVGFGVRANETVHALDRWATMTGDVNITEQNVIIGCSWLRWSLNFEMELIPKFMRPPGCFYRLCEIYIFCLGWS